MFLGNNTRKVPQECLNLFASRQEVDSYSPHDNDDGQSHTVPGILKQRAHVSPPGLLFPSNWKLCRCHHRVNVSNHLIHNFTTQLWTIQRPRPKLGGAQSSTQNATENDGTLRETHSA